MNFQAHLLTDEQSNHDKIYTAQEEILLGIHIVPRQSCIPFMLRDNWPIPYRKVIVFFDRMLHKIPMTQWPFIVI